MRSYNKNGIGLQSFKEMVLEVKEIIRGDIALDKCPFPNDILQNVPDYAHLIDYVYDRAKNLFENNPKLPVWADLRGETEVLYIRVKIQDRVCPVTLLTLHFSKCRSIAPKLCEQSLRWSDDAFRFIYGQ